MKKASIGNWITSKEDYEKASPVFRKTFDLTKKIKSATLSITSLGVYEAILNAKRVGDFVLAPGWTVYDKRIQEQEYDITDLLTEHNTLEVTLGNGWYVFPSIHHRWGDTMALLANIQVVYEDGEIKNISTDTDWECAKSNVLLSDLYAGETFDSRKPDYTWNNSVVFDHSKDVIIAQEGEKICEIKTLKAAKLITTPKGETVIDFGQNLTGYISFSICGNAGETVEINHAEVLDKEGNFYTDNLRSAKATITFTCNGEKQCYKPRFTFYGFRFIRLQNWPEDVKLENFTAHVVCSDIKRTGHFECSNPLINKLYENILWGQLGNFLDVPTDCPQRDERLGWTGDAQVFVRAATYNFNVQKFFKKWFRDLEANQRQNGSVPHVIPDVLSDATKEGHSSAAWGDAAVICPWQIYLTYGDKGVLQEQFESMKKWIAYIRAQGKNEFLWNTGDHFGDWLGLDAKEGSYKGSTPEDLIASAYFAYSTSLLIKAGKVLQKDMSEYENLYENIVKAFKENFFKNNKLIAKTQTAHALALYFDLCDDKETVAKDLADMVKANGNKLQTGFVGTPYLLHALSQNGYTDIAYSLLLQEDFPSWLYCVKKGATTIWEHWDGIREDGTMWSKDMNSFNHYAYGAVAEFMFGVIAGINTDENEPGFSHIILKPITDPRMTYANASIDTIKGKLTSNWKKVGDEIIYDFELPENTRATIIIGKNVHEVASGKHQYKA